MKNFYNLFAFLLVTGFIFPAAGAAQTTAVREVKPELEQAALKLLAEVEREARQFKLPENRIRAQVIAANLAWKHDEQAARAIFQNAFGELENLFVNVPVPESAEQLRSSEKSKLYSARYKLAQLRKDFILTLAGRDPQAALGALAALKTKPLDEDDPLGGNELELKVTAAIVKKDPDKSYTIAKEQLDAAGITYQFVEALKNLHKKDSKLAANLGRDVLGKIKASKIRIPTATGSTTYVKVPGELQTWDITPFIIAAAELNRAAARDKTKKTLPLLSDAEMKELVEALANAFLSERDPAAFSISQVMREITRYAPVLAERIRQKIGAEASRQMDRVVESSSFYTDSKEKTAEELAKDAAAAPPELRDSRFSHAAFKALEDNDPEKARAIAARIENRKSFGYLFEAIDAMVPIAKARRGDMQEVRRILATLSTNEERVMTLTELASSLAAKGEKETAAALLDESLQLMPAQVKKQHELELTAKIAGVFSVAAPERAFMMFEGSIGAMNDFINSGIKLDEFYGGGAAEADELLFLSINKQVLMYVPNSVELIRNLSNADFERTVALADKFERPEIRLFVRLRIAQALLDAKAAQKEKADLAQMVGVNDEDMN